MGAENPLSFCVRLFGWVSKKMA